MIKLLRVDHRLLHGQVAFSWTTSLSADCILIANDNVVNDDLRKMTMKMAKPNGVKLVIKSIQDSIVALQSGVTDKYKLLIVVESVEDAEKLTNACKEVTSINLGGTKVTPDTKNISKAVNINSIEEKILKSLVSKGIEVEIRMVPDDTKVLLEKVI